MKKIITICLAAMVTIVFVSCEKDPVKIIYEDGPLAGTTGGNGGGSVGIPPTPTRVFAEMTYDGNKVHVYWNESWDGSRKASYYKLYRSSSANGNYTMIAQTEDIQAYDDNPLQGDNYYKVKAVNSEGGESPYSDYAYCNYVGGNPDNLPTTLNESFEGDLDGWGVYDADGDGETWNFFQGGVNNSYCIGSYSWNPETETPISADNYLITPALYIPNDGRTLTYQVTNMTSSFPDHYSVVVMVKADDGGYYISQAQTIRSSETVSTQSPNFTSRSISLNGFKKKCIRIAFRHNDYDKIGIVFDDVRVQ